MEVLPMSTPLYTVNQFAEAHPAFSVSALRSLIFRRELNGFATAGAFPQVGRRRLIHEERFFQCILGESPNPAAHRAAPKPALTLAKKKGA
jgi:hypothetical protein